MNVKNMGGVIINGTGAGLTDDRFNNQSYMPVKPNAGGLTHSGGQNNASK